MFTAEHQYMTVIGDAYGGTERWQFGLRLSSNGSNAAIAAAVAPEIEAFFMGAGPNYASSGGGGQFLTPTTHRLTEVKVARVLSTGLYSPTEPAASYFYVPARIGAGGPAPAGQVAQNSLCVTLLTALPRGLASKGRLFLPPGRDYLPGPDGLLVAADALRICNAVRTLIYRINAIPVAGEVQIMSKGKAVATYNATRKRVEYDYPNAGATNVVTSVRCGRVVDTQRRRRRSLNETAVNSTV